MVVVMSQSAFAETSEYFRRLTGFGPHPPGSAAHEDCGDYISETMKAFGAQVEEETFYYENDLLGRMKGRNIIAHFGKKDGKRVGFATHWDTRPVADRDPDPSKRMTPIEGANDGNSSTAVLLALGEYLSGKKDMDHGVTLYFFDAEDSGISSSGFSMGAKYHVAHSDLSGLRFGVLVDMIGERDLRIPMEGYSVEAAGSLCRKIWDHARYVKGYYFFADETGPRITDDHLPFLMAGIPFVDIIDIDYEYWHTVEDTADKCSIENMNKIFELLKDIADTPGAYCGNWQD